jgi:hypothetical protein
MPHSKSLQQHVPRTVPSLEHTILKVVPMLVLLIASAIAASLLVELGLIVVWDQWERCKSVTKMNGR